MKQQLAPVLIIASCGLALPAIVLAQTTRPTTQPATTPPSDPADPNRSGQSRGDRAAQVIAMKIPEAHGLDAWRGKQAVEAQIVVEFGGETMLDAKMLYDMHNNRVRMETRGGPLLVFDGKNAWVSPAEAEMPMARFHLLTWPYFFAAPFKLNDPGTQRSIYQVLTLNGEQQNAFKLTFEGGVGDTPDDWYIVYADSESHQLSAMAYIVTYGQSAEKADQEPHAIVYKDSRTIDGVVLSTAWEFFNWSSEKGVHGEPIGNATLRDIRFVKPADDAFAKPPEAREDTLPQAE